MNIAPIVKLTWAPYVRGYYLITAEGLSGSFVVNSTDLQASAAAEARHWFNEYWKAEQTPFAEKPQLYNAKANRIAEFKALPVIQSNLDPAEYEATLADILVEVVELYASNLP